MKLADLELRSSEYRPRPPDGAFYPNHSFIYSCKVLFSFERNPRFQAFVVFFNTLSVRPVHKIVGAEVKNYCRNNSTTDAAQIRFEETEWPMQACNWSEHELNGRKSGQC